VSGGFWDTADDYSHTFNVENELVSVSNNGLAYFYSDHLGSASALQKPDASMAYTWYLPFGGYRPGSAHTQSSNGRDFTGQHENMELGLLYYNARFYAPTLGRFISADSIVPNPANPQSYNRYAYVLNRTLNFTDPTGHRECDLATGDCSGGPGSFTPYKPPPSPEPPSNLITALPLDNVTWTGGFGPNWYSDVFCGQACYSQSHNIHTGLDFGGNAGDTVYATVSGTIVAVAEYAEDADPNVIIAVTIGGITYYVIHGHVNISDPELIGKQVEAGAPIGTLDDGPDYPHVHLGIRQETEGQDRAWNPLLYMDSDLTVGMSFVSDDHPYYGNESPTSIRSFLYGTGSYFDEENQASMGIIR
jgi:RHS repeat-associated protein